MLPNLSPRPLLDPPASPVADLQAAITPPARRSFAHLYGLVRGSRVTYPDLNAFVWWYGGGWLTVNRGRRGLARAHRGAEDVTQIRR